MKKMLSRFTAMMLRQFSVLKASSMLRSERPEVPAAKTMMSKRPKSATHFSTAALQTSSLEASPAKYDASPPAASISATASLSFSSRRATKNTLAPCAASALAL